ncbi:MAG: hypothetical protein AB1556_17025 [Bacillota bacterium]
MGQEFQLDDESNGHRSILRSKRVVIIDEAVFQEYANAWRNILMRPTEDWSE